MTVEIDTEAGNKAYVDGSLKKAVMGLMDEVKPEAAFFTTHDGHRTGYIVFDMKDPSQMVGLSEPLFQGLNAKVSYAPVMNPDDLQKGMSAS
jgi:hypothetical protein